MSDTMTVKTLCDHGRADPHHMNLGTAVCPGGKEITLRLLRPKFVTPGPNAEVVGNVWVEVDNA